MVVNLGAQNHGKLASFSHFPCIGPQQRAQPGAARLHISQISRVVHDSAGIGVEKHHLLVRFQRR